MSKTAQPCSLYRLIYIPKFVTQVALRSSGVEAMALELNPISSAPTEEQIRHAESNLGFRLPDEYRTLLTSCNGAKPLPHEIKINGQSYEIAIFLTVDQLAQHKASLDRFNASGLRLLPVALDSGGNWFCVATCEAKAGHVYFVDHEMEGDQAFTEISNDLTKLLEKDQITNHTQVDDPATITKVWVKPGFLDSLKKTV